MAIDLLLRVSAAALCRVIFPHPQTGVMLLALERRASRANIAAEVYMQPFGGALRILDPVGFRTAVGDFAYDSVRSREEQDLRILIPPTAWEAARGFILAQMQARQPEIIETNPCRELAEEFSESVGVTLLPEHYTYRSIGISVQDRPVPTTNPRLPGASTVRIYRIFEVMIRDRGVCDAILESSQRFTDEELQSLAEADAPQVGKGRVNGALVIPLDEVRNAYRGISTQGDDQMLSINGHHLGPSSAMLFEEFHNNI